MPCEKTPCSKSGSNFLLRGKKKMGFFAGIILAILPKCPFCIMAYSGTVMLCGKDTLLINRYTYNSLLSISLVVLFCSLIIAGLLLNFRGKLTKFALALALPGILLIINSVIRNGGSQLFYLGVSIIFMAVWLNGNMISILRKFKSNFSSIITTAERGSFS